MRFLSHVLVRCVDQSTDENDRHDRDRAWAVHALWRDGSKDAMQEFVKYYVETTKMLIKRESYKISGIPGTRVDIVRNVINLVSVHWTADYLVRIRSFPLIPISLRTH